MTSLPVKNLILALFFFAQVKFIKTEVKVDANKSKAWGPGLDPTKIVLPARYFFVQLYDADGKLVNVSDDGLEVHMSGDSTARPCRVWNNILNRKDGSYIVRFKVYEPCRNFKIDLRYKNMPVQGFPKKFEEPVLSDNCNCPQPVDTWLETMQCDKNYPQIQSDLELFPHVEFKSVHENILKQFQNPGSVSLCHYVVKKNEIYRKCYGQYVGFNIFMDAILLSLARKIVLPSFEMFVNLGDWPLARNTSEILLPIFSWCGSKDTSDIVMPTYDLTEATLECMGRVQLDMLSVQGSATPAWEDKISKGFWRGRDSRRERLDLVELSRKLPDLLDASLTNFFFFRDEQDKYGPKVDHVSFFDFFKYKYQVSLDGTVAAYRLPYLLAGDGVVLKQDSSFYEHFYNDLVPMQHYVPFKHDLSDLPERIQWLKDHEQLARNISHNGRLLAVEKLMPAHIFCYHAALFNEWSHRLLTTPEVLEGMEHVPQPDALPCPCPLFEKDEL